MSNSVAEAYLLIVRESLVPIYGEAVPIPFTGQIELDAWSWDLRNDQVKDEADEDEKPKAGKGGSATGTDPKKKKTEPLKPDGLIRAVSEIQTRKGMPQEERDKRVKG